KSSTAILRRTIWRTRSGSPFNSTENSKALVQHLLDFVTHFISSMGYGGIVFLMTLSSACIPVPSEAIMPFSGSLIVTDPARGFTLHFVAISGAIGDLIGS